MRLKAIICEVFTREFEEILSRCAHKVDLEIVTMGLHDLGASMRPDLQGRVDAADESGYDAIIFGYGLCGRGTEGLRAGKTPLVLPRAHDCIGLLMGSRQTYQAYFENHPVSTIALAVGLNSRSRDRRSSRRWQPNAISSARGERWKS